MELLEDGRPTPSRWPSCSTPPTSSTARGHPWVADHELAPQVGGARHVRAGDDVRRVRRLLRAGPLRGAGAALPRRRLQGAAPDRPGGRADRGAGRPHRVAGRAGPPGRLQPARRVGAAAQPGRPSDGRGGARPTTGRRAVTANPARSGCWCATRMFRRVELAALRRYDELGELDGEHGLGRRALGGGAGAVLRRARRARHRPGRARSGAAASSTSRAAAAGRCARSSTTRPATTTGASRAEVDLAASDEPGAAAVRILDVGPL